MILISSEHFHLITFPLSQETIRYHYLKPSIVSLAHNDPQTWNKIKIFRKFFFKFSEIKFYEKIAETRDKKMTT